MALERRARTSPCFSCMPRIRRITVIRRLLIFVPRSSHGIVTCAFTFKTGREKETLKERGRDEEIASCLSLLRRRCSCCFSRFSPSVYREFAKASERERIRTVGGGGFAAQLVRAADVRRVLMYGTCFFVNGVARAHDVCGQCPLPSLRRRILHAPRV